MRNTGKSPARPCCAASPFLHGTKIAHSKAADVAAVLAERDKHIKTLEAENKRLRRLGECKFFCPITAGAGVCANISKGLVISEGLGHGGC